MRIINHIHDSIKSPFHEHNEDAILIINTDNYSLFFLFDGVGSAVHALDAIKIASEFISNNYKKYEQGEDFQLAKLMHDSHLEILNSKLNRALSTYVAIFIPNGDNKEISISSIGDSRIYGVSSDYIFQYTEDDIVPNVEDTISKSLGMLKINDVDFYQKDFIPKESRYLIASDGFYELMEDSIQEFEEILNFSNLDDVKKALHNNMLGNNKDDASYVLLEIK